MSEDQNNQPIRADTPQPYTPQPESGVFIVHTRFSSPNKQDGTTEISDQKVEIDYTFKKETRQQIARIAVKHKTRIYEHTLTFPPIDDGNPNVLRLCKGDQVAEISKIVQEANKELQEVGKALHASYSFFPINIYEVQKGELYGQVIAAIRYQILKEAVDRIGEKTGQLNTQSRKAMERMVERLRAINVFNDSAIDKMLNETLEKIISQDVAEVKKSLEAELQQLSQRAAFIDLT